MKAVVKRPRERGRKRDPVLQRGYGAEHRQLRKHWSRLVEAGQVSCARCGGWIRPGEPWDLGHHDRDRSIYVGPEHARCNRGATRRKAIRKRRIW